MLRIIFILCCFFATQGFAQESPPSSPQSQEMVTTQESDDLMPAPLTYKGAFAKMMLTLFGLIALIVLTVWMLRRVSHGRLKQMNYGRSIKILERRPLSAKSILYLVEVDGKKVVVSESQLDVRTITTADHLLPTED